MSRWVGPLAWALLALTAARLLAAGLLPLTPDEAYYWVWGRTLQSGYLDHPPVVALWIAAGTALLGDSRLGIRLFAPLGVALASLALADAGRLLFPDRRVGPAAALILNAMPLTNAGAVLMTPDTPLIVLWCLALWSTARLHATGNGRWWFAVGAFAGAGLAAKYTMALFGVGLVLWLLADATARRWWRDPRLYLGGILAALLFAPVLAWNATHGWASFAKQGGRAGTGNGATLRYLAELVGGQLLLASPVLLIAAAAGIALCAAAWARRRDPAAGLLLALTLPALLVFLWQATGSRVQGNWPAILYPAASLAAAAFVAPRWTRAGAAIGLGLTLLVTIQAVATPLPLPRRYDPTLARLGGWPALAREADAARRAAGADALAAEEYGLAAQLAFHAPPGVPVIAAADRWSLFERPSPAPGLTVLLLHSTRRAERDLAWPGAEPAGTLARTRDGEEAETYRLLRATTPPGAVPAITLPRPR